MTDPLFDTNIVIDWLRRYPQAAQEMSLYGRHRISRVTWAEVLAGEPMGSRDRVSRLIEHFEVVELDDRIAAFAAELRHRTQMKLLDAFILATARLHGAVLITRNFKDFPATMPGVRIPYTL